MRLFNDNTATMLPKTEGFVLKTTDGRAVRFRYYTNDAPVTVQTFAAQLPFALSLYHARVSGQEIWRASAFDLDIIQENASVFTEPGEVVLSPKYPMRNKAAGGAIGIYYGEGRGLDACNIFARAFEEDMQVLKAIGEQIWKQGEQELIFEVL